MKTPTLVAACAAFAMLAGAVVPAAAQSYHPHRGGYADRQAYGGYAHRDTVGSITYDGRGYATNRYSGQVYRSCVFDLGYGRVQPCDAGTR